MNMHGTVPTQYVSKTIAEKRAWKESVHRRKSYVNRCTYDDYDNIDLCEMRVRRDMQYEYIY